MRSREEQPTGTCRVAAFGSAARALVPSMLECQRRHPGVRVELVESEPEVAIPELLSGDVDLVVSEEYPDAHRAAARTCIVRPWPSDPLELVVAEGLLGARPGRGRGDLPWALEPVGAASRAWTLRHCLGLGFTPSVQYESWDLDLLLRWSGSAPRPACCPAWPCRLSVRPRR